MLDLPATLPLQPAPPPTEWIEDIAPVFATTTGLLAGFSLTVVVLLSPLALKQKYGSLVPACGVTFFLALVSFLVTTMFFSLVLARSDEHQQFLYSAGVVLYFFSMVILLLGFCLLATFLDVKAGPGRETGPWRNLERAMRWVLVGTILAGYALGAAALWEFQEVPRWALLAGLVAAFGLSRVLPGDVSVRRTGRVLLYNITLVLGPLMFAAASFLTNVWSEVFFFVCSYVLLFAVATNVMYVTRYTGRYIAEERERCSAEEGPVATGDAGRGGEAPGATA